MKISKFTIASLFLVIFVDAAGIGIVFPVLTPMLINNETGLFSASISEAVRYQVYGIMLALYPLAMFVASPLLGDMSDRFGRKPVLLLCLAGTALGMLGGFNRSSQHLKLRRCCHGSKCKASVSVDRARSDVLTGCAVA